MTAYVKKPCPGSNWVVINQIPTSLYCIHTDSCCVIVLLMGCNIGACTCVLLRLVALCIESLWPELLSAVT